MPKLSVIIPNYNEKENLNRGVLEEVAKYLKSAPFSYEVIISDDGSTDGSLKIAQEFAQKQKSFRVLENQHKGKAQTVWSGIQAAKGEIVLFTDMDQSTPLKEVEKLLPWYEKDFDVVFGSRGKARQDFPWYRLVMSTVFRLFRQSMLLREVSDTQCGFKSFRRNVALEIFPKLEIINQPTLAKGWSVSAFDVELLFLAEKFGYKLKEVDVDWRDRDVAKGKSKNFAKESIDMIKQILRVKLNDLQKKYG